MIIKTNKTIFAIVCIAFGVLALVIPKGWDEARVAKIVVAAFFIGMGWLGLKYP